MDCEPCSRTAKWSSLKPKKTPSIPGKNQKLSSPFLRMHVNFHVSLALPLPLHIEFEGGAAKGNDGRVHEDRLSSHKPMYSEMQESLGADLGLTGGKEDQKRLLRVGLLHDSGFEAAALFVSERKRKGFRAASVGETVDLR